MSKKTFYEVLQVTQTADTEIIKAAYNSLIQRFYPEGSPHDPKDDFLKALNQAYEVLSDPAKRAGYDAALANIGEEVTPAKQPEPVRAESPANEAEESHPYTTTGGEENNKAMKWGLYIGWFSVWFVLHSFIFVPIIKSSGGIIAALAAFINIMLLISGYVFINKRFGYSGVSLPPVGKWTLGILGAALLVAIAVPSYDAYQKNSSKQESDQIKELGKRAADGDASALQQLLSLANKGNVKAQSKLGWMYSSGKGVPQDDVQAVQWTRKAADQGNRSAQSNLGWLYANGKGVPQDYEQAVQWYRKAADQGDAEAQTNLGSAYSHGQGVEQDYEQAVQWYRKAADQGFAAAQTNLGSMYFNGKGVSKDEVRAVQLLRKAADQGYAEAQYRLGGMYISGQGVPPDDIQAAQWYRKAADQGDAKAQYELGTMYFSGQGVPPDDVQGFKWFYIAKANGYIMRDHIDGKKMFNELESLTPPGIITEAQRLAQEWLAAHPASK